MSRSGSDAEDRLAPYGSRSSASLGRRFDEAPPRHRSEFQRDRDRVIHATAFRRLVYKTQVFVNHEGDLYRTRLTHSLEVAQIARTVARALRLNEDLVEAISLAHDLGHTPFGHAGQDALNSCMQAYGGFEHNLQSLRVVDELENRYAAFPGLNLTFETREGILKHCSKRNARELGAVGERFLNRTQPSLEAQLANLADEIAYNNHDVDDGLRAGLIDLDNLRQVSWVAAHISSCESEYPGLAGRKLASEVVRRLIDELVGDLVENSRRRIEAAGVDSPGSVRAQSTPLIGFSDAMAQAQQDVKTFLHANLYRHPKVRAMTANARKMVDYLFKRFLDDPELMPDEHRHRALEPGADRPRVVADYVAGMTDRFAIDTYDRLQDR